VRKSPKRREVKKMKKIWIGIGIAVILALLSSCGGGGPTTTTITGRVVDATNPQQGVPNATVELYPTKSRQTTPVAKATTDAQGYYSLTANAGEYTLHIELPDGSYQAVELNIVASGTVKIDIRMVPRNITIATVNITPPTPDGPNNSYVVGETYKFQATAFDPSGKPLDIQPTWCITTKGDIGTIDQDGNFTAKKPGTGTVWAIFTQDKKASVDITVTQLQGITAQALQRCFPLTVGSQWSYNETKEQEFSTTSGESHTKTANRTDTVTIPGTYSGAPFSQEVVIRQHHKVGPVTIDGKTEQSDGFDREFWTNLNGELKLWGFQDWQPNPQTPPPYTNPDTQGTWEQIEALPQPDLLAKANVTSWTVGKLGDDMDIVELGMLADATATLSTEKITVPAGTFNCYKITISLSNPQFSVPSNVQILKVNSFSGKMEIWVADGVGLVKSVFQWQGSADYKDLETNKTGTATFSSREVEELTSYSVK
jgi:hypothetical protein